MKAIKVFFSIIVIFFVFHGKLETSLTQADHDTLFVHFQILSQNGWVQSSVDVCQQIVGNSEYNWQDWDELFWEYYHTYPATRNLWNYLVYPTYWWFGDNIHYNLQQGQKRSFVEISDSILATHGDTLGLYLENNTDIREALFLYLRGIAGLVNHQNSVIHDTSRNSLISLVESLIDLDYPQYYKKYNTLGPNEYPYMALIGYQLHALLVDSEPLTDDRIDSLVNLLGVSGIYESLMRDHLLYIADNNGMSTVDLSYIYEIMSLIPDTLTDLVFLSNIDYYYVSDQERESITSYSGGVNTFSTIGGYQENGFPPEVVPLYIDGFSVVVAHEVNHRLDPDYISQIPKLQARREQLLSQAGYDDLQYLRSMVGGNFFQTYPQEFIASIANQWFSSSDHTLQLALIRFDAGYHEPINQVLYFCELYSVETDTTRFYTVDTQGNIDMFLIPLGRDINGNINQLAIQDIVYNFEIDSIGNTISYGVSDFFLILSEIEAFQGDTVAVPLTVVFPPDSTFSSAEITIGDYQNGLDFVEVDTANSMTGDAGWTYAINETDSLLITWSAGAQDISGTGVFCWLKFAVIGDICTFVPITIESALFNTGDNPVTTTNGGVYINAIPVYGDVDVNGLIQAYDASLILKHLVGIDTLDCQALANANVSLDTTVSGLDGSLILQYGVGLIDTLPYDTSMGSLFASGDIEIDEDNIQIEQTVEIPLYLSNGDNILSFEGLVTFNPEHLTFDEIYWTDLLDGFTIEINEVNGEIKFAGANTFPDGEEGTFAKLRFTNNMNWTQTTIILDNLRWNEETIMDNVASATLSFVGIDDRKSGIPTEFSLSQNYPNPFNPVTTISFQLPKSAMVSLSIYNIVGQLVEKLVNERKNAGFYSVQWNARNVGSGLYFYRIEAGEYSETKKCLILK